MLYMLRQMRRRLLLLIAYTLLVHAWPLDGQLSKPIVSNSQIDVSSNKYLQRVNEDDADNTER